MSPAAVRFRFSEQPGTGRRGQLLPYAPLTIGSEERTVRAFGLVDSGADVSVLPHVIGLQLGLEWSHVLARIPLGGAFASEFAIPMTVTANVEGLPATNLAFLWTQSPAIPLILGHTNFFDLYDVSFFRSLGEFEIRLASTSK